MEITQRKPEPQRRLDEWDMIVKPFDWKTYNDSQTKEKLLFLKLLDDLCNLVDDDKYTLTGRKPKSLSHQIFCICLKIYLNTSSRRLISEIELCRRRGHLDAVPHFNSVLNYFNNPQIKRTLTYLIELSSLPLAQLEEKFAVDSTGFSERKYMEKWSDVRQKFSLHRQYRKAHCIYGVYSNIVSSAIVTEGTANDSPMFAELLKATADNFNVKEVSADLGYSSRENMKYADELGITPFIPFKKNAIRRSKGAMVWNRMYKYFKENKEDFLKHYHARSNAESGFFMIKQRFGDYVNCKNDMAQTNEILAKILCHNICVLIQEIFLSNLDINFYYCAEKYLAQKQMA